MAAAGDATRLKRLIRWHSTAALVSRGLQLGDRMHPAREWLDRLVEKWPAALMLAFVAVSSTASLATAAVK